MDQPEKPETFLDRALGIICGTLFCLWGLSVLSMAALAVALAVAGPIDPRVFGAALGAFIVTTILCGVIAFANMPPLLVIRTTTTTRYR
jgi:hypothetical protein